MEAPYRVISSTMDGKCVVGGPGVWKKVRSMDDAEVVVAELNRAYNQGKLAAEGEAEHQRTWAGTVSVDDVPLEGPVNCSIGDQTLEE